VAAALLLIVLLLVPAVAAAQIPTYTPYTLPPQILSPTVIQPWAPQGPGVIEITPRTPPPSTIPSGPDVFLPVPTAAPDAARPPKKFDFRPSLSLIEEFTDNFNQAATKPRSNFRSGLAPGISLLFDDGPITAQATYTLFSFYDTLPKDTGLHHSLAAQLGWQMTPLVRLGVAEAFATSDEPARADRLNLRRGRQEFTTNTTSLTGDYVASFLKAAGYYRFSIFDSTDEKTTSHTTGVNVTRPLSQINALTLGYEYLTTESERQAGTTTTTTNLGGTFPTATQGTTTTNGHQFSATFTRDLRSDLSAGVTGAYILRHQERIDGQDDFRRWSVSIFSNYVVPEKIVILSSIGVAQLTGGGSDGRPLLTSTTGLTYWFGPATLNLGIERGFSETFTTGQNNGVIETTGYSGSLSYRFTPLLTASIGASHRENKTTGVGNTQTGTAQDEKITAGTFALTYQILRWLTSTLDYTHTEVETNNVLGYKENRVRFVLSALFY
jgi:hypothetical protein